MSSRALVTSSKSRRAIRNRILGPRSSPMEENRPKWIPEITKKNSKNPESQRNTLHLWNKTCLIKKFRVSNLNKNQKFMDPDFDFTCRAKTGLIFELQSSRSVYQNQRDEQGLVRAVMLLQAEHLQASFAH